MPASKFPETGIVQVPVLEVFPVSVVVVYATLVASVLVSLPTSLIVIVSGVEANP